ncbi:MAG: Fe-S cluster assembly ATPase SufC [Bacilli bacterium]|nr:Fe-S cluster assembly ATPase SufC [Bacilli bacterium]
MQFTIKDLFVNVTDKEILKGFDLEIKPGEIHAIMGPNGTGKSTLSKVIMGYPSYKIIKGDILVNNESIINLETDERSKLGIFLVYQNPLSIEGISNSEFIRSALNARSDKPIGLYEFVKKLEKSFADLSMDKSMMHRSLNQDFSGGEKKKNEILQMLMLKPKFIILDELDSGLDVDSLKIVCDNINRYIQENSDVSLLIITHYTRILEYIKPNYVHMMKDGKIKQSGTYELAKQIEKYGYNKSYALTEDSSYE